MDFLQGEKLRLNFSNNFFSPPANLRRDCRVVTESNPKRESPGPVPTPTPGIGTHTVPDSLSRNIPEAGNSVYLLRQPLLDSTLVVRKLFLTLFQEERSPLVAWQLPHLTSVGRDRVKVEGVSVPKALAGLAAPHPHPGSQRLPLRAKRGGVRRGGAVGDPPALPCCKSLPSR